MIGLQDISLAQPKAGGGAGATATFGKALAASETTKDANNDRACARMDARSHRERHAAMCGEVGGAGSDREGPLRLAGCSGRHVEKGEGSRTVEKRKRRGWLWFLGAVVLAVVVLWLSCTQIVCGCPCALPRRTPRRGVSSSRRSSADSVTPPLCYKRPVEN